MNEVMITTVLSIATGLSGFYWGIKKNSADLQNTALTNIQTQIAIYETIIESLREEIQVLCAKVEEQKTIINGLEKKIEEMYKN